MGVLVFAHILFAGVGVVLAVIDQKTHRLPDVLTLPLWAATALSVGLVSRELGENSTEHAFAASAVTVLALWLIAELPGRPLGFGDVKLGGIIGLQLGVYGLDVALGALVLAFILGGTVATVSVVSGRRRPDEHIAFGPYLIQAALLGIIGGAR